MVIKEQARGTKRMWCQPRRSTEREQHECDSVTGADSDLPPVASQTDTVSMTNREYHRVSGRSGRRGERTGISHSTKPTQRVAVRGAVCPHRVFVDERNPGFELGERGDIGCPEPGRT